MANKKVEKTFDAVKMMRDIRDKITLETQGMSFDELKKYIDARVTKTVVNHPSK